MVGGRKQNGNRSQWHITTPGRITIGLVVLLAISAVFMGYSEILGNLLELGFLFFLFVNWLAKH